MISTTAAVTANFSLEDILAEYRAAPGADELQLNFAEQESPLKVEDPVPAEEAAELIPEESTEHVEGYVDDGGQYAAAPTEEAMDEAWEDDEYCRTELGLDGALGSIDRSRLNVNGSSLAAGHPFAATGGRIVASGTMEALTEGHSLEEAFLEADSDE